MKKWQLRSIIITMGLAVLGLVYFQWRWVESLLLANEERFNRDVIESMQRVVMALEQQEVERLVSRRIVQQSSIPVPPDPTRVTRTQFTASGTMDTSQSSINFFFGIDDKGEVVFSSNAPGTVEIIQDGQVQAFNDLNNTNNKTIKEAYEKVSNKSHIMNTVLEELVVTPRFLGNRFNPRELDSLLAAEFANQGITTPYDYAVAMPMSGRMITVSNPPQARIITQSRFRTQLFPNDIAGEPGLLFVDFPEKDAFVLSSVMVPMSSSGVLMLLILGCFGYAVMVIVKQKKLSEMKTDFVNNMTHELKTPIATIGLAVEALQDQDLANAVNIRERYLGVIRDENRRLGTQVEKVLQMALLDNKEINLKLEPLDVHDAIALATEKIRLQVESSSGELNVVLEATHSTIQADQGHLLNVLLNLLDNAVKYSEDAPKIMVRTHNTSQHLVVAVKDHGIGMTRDQVKHVFDRFYRVSTGNVHNVKGFGLGLAYVKNMMALFKGEVLAESQPGQGSIFKLVFSTI